MKECPQNEASKASRTKVTKGFKTFKTAGKAQKSGWEARRISIEDSTFWKPMENQRSEALSLLGQVSQRVPGLVYQFLLRQDGTSCFPFASDGIREIYRLSPDDVREDASKVISVIHPDDLDLILESLRKSARDLSPWVCEYRVKHTDGCVRWLSGNGFAERCESGILWNGYICDITERKESERALLRSEEKYRNLAGTYYHGVMVVRQDGSIEYVNEQLEKIFGYNPNELLNEQFCKLVSEADRERLSEVHGICLRNSEKREEGLHLNLNGRRKDSTEFPLDISLRYFYANSELLVNCIVRDLTEIKKTEEKRRFLSIQEKALREEAIRRNSEKDELLATLSHELRTPLTTILGWVQQLRVKELDPEVMRALLIIERSAKAQGQLVDDLLDISRIHSGKIGLELKVIDIVEILKLAISSVSILATKKSVQLEADLPSVQCSVLADTNRLQQIFWNILSNAIKFTPRYGKVSVKLELIEKENGKFVQVQICDTGMGIKREFLERIFERFSQVDSSMTRVYGGLGLGLAIVKSLVEQHKGTIEAKSEGEGKGSNFILTLPRVRKKGGEISLKISEPPLVRLDGLKALVIDDNVDNLYLFDIILKSLGAEVRTGESAQNCLEIMEVFKPDILLSDISMPGEDGYSLIRKVRALDEAKGGGVPAIALTAYASPEDVRVALNAGFSGHVAKPVEKNILAEAITRIINS